MTSAVWITRPEADNHALAHALSTLSIPTVAEPVTRITMRPFTLPTVPAPQAMIITSKHAVHALVALPESWHKVPVYCSGATTAAQIQSHGFTPHMHASAQAIDIALQQALRPQSAIVYFSGADITHPFAADTHHVTRYIVYEAQPILTPSATFIHALQTGQVIAAMLFSLRHATLAGHWLQHYGRPIPAWCLSSAVTQAATQAGFAACHTAPTPTNAAMLALARQHYPAMITPV
jgi:uroporphyrinogen-III synthase